MKNLFSGKNSIYILAPFSGFLLSLAYPPIGLGYLGFFCLIPYLVALYGRDTKTGFMSGIFLGIPYFFITQYWIYHSIDYYGGVPFLLSISVVFLLCLYESLYTAVFGMFTAYFTSKKRTSLLSAIAPFLWVALEFLRAHLFTGFPWSLLGYTQERFLPFIQIADITGIYGISFIVMLINTAIADIIISLILKKSKYQKESIFVIITTFVIFVISIYYGIHRIKEINEITLSSKKIKIAIIQGNIDQSQKWDNRYQKYVFERYMDLTRTSMRENPQLIVWPETALPFYPDLNREMTEKFKSFVREIKTPLLTGAVLVRDKRIINNTLSYSITNSAILYDKNGNETFIYDKIHLVPFGEYIPLKNLLFFINRLVEGIGEYKAGTSYKQAKLKWGTFSTIICYEAIFPALVRRLIGKSGNFLINITNDAWFGKTSGPYQHFSISRFRAIENRVPLVRAANTGISGFISLTGEVSKKLDIFKTGILIAKIPLVNIKSFYKYYGDVFSYLNLIYIIFVITTFKNKRGGI